MSEPALAQAWVDAIAALDNARQLAEAELATARAHLEHATNAYCYVYGCHECAAARAWLAGERGVSE